MTEAGLAYTASLPASHTLSLEAGAGFTSEHRIGVARLRFATATGMLSYGWRITPAIELHDDLSIAPDLSAARHWRAANMLTFKATLTRLLAIKFSHRIEYRHEPVPGFGRVDTKTSAALVFSFRSLR